MAAAAALDLEMCPEAMQQMGFSVSEIKVLRAPELSGDERGFHWESAKLYIDQIFEVDSLMQDSHLNRKVSEARKKALEKNRDLLKAFDNASKIRGQMRVWEDKALDAKVERDRLHSQWEAEKKQSIVRKRKEIMRAATSVAKRRRPLGEFGPPPMMLQAMDKASWESYLERCLTVSDTSPPAV